MADFLICILLEVAEFIEELLVGSLTIRELLFKLVVSVIEFISPFCQMSCFCLIDIDQVLFDHFKILCISSLEVLDLSGILLIKLHFEIIVGVQDAIHVLFGLFLSFKERLLSAIKLIIQSLHLVHQSTILTLQKVLVLRKEINLTAELLGPSLDFILAILKLDKLIFQHFVV